METLETLLRLRQRPAGQPCVMRQSWEELLFLHWRFPAEEVRRTLPEGLEVDTFDGSAWVGVIPFFMRRVRPNGLPAVPILSDFLESNVRTYVHDGTDAGVWFYSLDCNQPIAVEIARRFFKLNYIHADMQADPVREGIRYRSKPRGSRPEIFRYRRGREEAEARPGTLEFFLIERYLLFSYDPARKHLHRGRVYHPPYRFSPVQVDAWSAQGIRRAGLPAPDRPPDHAIAVRRIDVEIFPLQ